MEAEMMESDKRIYRRPLLVESSSSTTLDKGKAPQQAPVNPNRSKAKVMIARQFVELEVVDEEEDTKVEDEYAGVEFAMEEGVERLTLVLQRILLSLKEDRQRHCIFCSLCSIKNKVCEVIVDNGSCENFVEEVGEFVETIS
ncbi:Hypothetical predicted protein [Olea europaea subsp. europaea]|uniref:Uncharacterized protein n=1 Tax=Olea europaea subsp. europaea TaxID=158383 RepID=A0A8S0SSA8_OLEEU|nr:Hypothetical predicted protein [Olea europaea subsp. europaea]